MERVANAVDAQDVVCNKLWRYAKKRQVDEFTKVREDRERERERERGRERDGSRG